MYRCCLCGVKTDFDYHVKGFHHKPGRVCMSCDVEVERAGRYMRFHGFVYQDGKFWKPYTNESCTWREAIDRMKEAESMFKEIEV